MNTRTLTDPSRYRLRDLLDESLSGLFARPARLALTVLGTVIGLAALVATLGLAQTSGNRIVGHFDELAATEVIATSRPSATSAQNAALPWDAAERVARLNGVVAAGTLSTVDVGDRLVSASAINDPENPTNFRLTVTAASHGAFPAVHAVLRTGRVFDEGHSRRSERVAVLGPAAANRLGIDRVDQLSAIRIGDEILLVVGILDGVARQPDLLSAVIIPEGTARTLFRLSSPALAVVDARIGAASLIASQLSIALRPDDPRTVRVASPREPTRVRDAVQTDLDLLSLILGSVSLLVGAIGIANVTLVAVMERTGEIGLRRALGATRLHVGAQFLVESATVGFVGGVIGACLGTLVVVAVSAINSWTPVVDPLVPVLAPVLGALVGLVGLVSGTYPAIRAARLEPVDALRAAT